jgi:hypothetical protein
VRFRGQFAYVAGELADGEQMPLMRLRYGGSAHRWGTAIYVASKDSYEDQIWFSGSTEEIFDLVCDLHVTNADHDHQPHTSTPTVNPRRTYGPDHLGGPRETRKQPRGIARLAVKTIGDHHRRLSLPACNYHLLIIQYAI